MIGAVSIILIGVIVRDMGGRKWAQFLAGFGFLLSPAFLASNTLFQPVSFNQFFWLVAALLVVKIIRYQQPRYWYLLGVTAGLGFLNKYSIAFLMLAGVMNFNRKRYNLPETYSFNSSFIMWLPESLDFRQANTNR